MDRTPVETHQQSREPARESEHPLAYGDGPAHQELLVDRNRDHGPAALEQVELAQLALRLQQPVPFHAEIYATVPFFLRDPAAMHLRVQIPDVPGETAPHVVLAARLVWHSLLHQARN